MKARAIVRAYAAADAEGIEKLFREFVAYLRSIGDQNDYRFDAKQYRADGFGADPAFRGFVAEDESGLVGYLLFSRYYDGDYVRNFYIADLYVLQAARGRGIGRLLMDAVCQLAQMEGVVRLTWAVHKNNAGAIRFYEALGAKYVREAHVMHLDLP